MALSPGNKNRLYSAIGALAFVVGGLLARASAMENAQKLEGMFTKKTEEISDPRTPPPLATTEQ